MSVQSIREFTGRHLASSAGLAALVAALDAKACGAPLNPTLSARVQDLLAALGAGNVLDDITAEEARLLVPEIRHHIRFDATLMSADTRTTTWSYTDTRLLQDVGDFARSHAHLVTDKMVPALDGLPQRLGAPGAAFLDIGVGVGGTAIAMAQLWPQLHVTGIDVWQPSLALARDNVAKSPCPDRIELREQGAENLEDDRAFDLVWMPVVFMPERVIPAAVERAHRALRPGGWLIVANVNLEGIEPLAAAVWRLRLATFGGPLRTPAEVESMLRDRGFSEVRTFPRPPNVPAGFSVGRRSPT